jgi:hypothetical protein
MMTQGRMLIAALRRKPHTYLEMMLTCISTSPQKRIVESLRPDEVLVKSKKRNGLVTWAVKRRKE